MIEIKKPVIPEKIEEYLIEARKEAERATRNDIRWDIEDIIQFAKKIEPVKEWFNESPENMEEFILAFFYSYEVDESWFYLKFKYPEYLNIVEGDSFLNYNTYDEELLLSSSDNSVKYQTIFRKSDIDKLGINLNDFKKVWCKE